MSFPRANIKRFNENSGMMLLNMLSPCHFSLMRIQNRFCFKCFDFRVIDLFKHKTIQGSQENIFHGQAPGLWSIENGQALIFFRQARMKSNLQNHNVLQVNKLLILVSPLLFKNIDHWVDHGLIKCKQCTSFYAQGALINKREQVCIL